MTNFYKITVKIDEYRKLKKKGGLISPKKAYPIFTISTDLLRG
jgi:hypothetical protein